MDLTELAMIGDLQLELRKLEHRILKWLIPILLRQIAVFAALVKWSIA